jgi:Protein of unknown function (DUF1549)/Protein of unknown function (DUF1553)
MGIRDIVFLAIVVNGIVMLGINLVPPTKPAPRTQYENSLYQTIDHREGVQKLDLVFQEHWKTSQIAPTSVASDLQIARRISLALMGTIPSLEEVRQFEALPESQRLEWWFDHVLEDPRHADFFAERFARTFVGTEEGPFLLFRRRRFVSWIADELKANRPYDEFVRELIAGKGIWTDKPATNFITVTSRPEMQNQPDPVRLASRVTRAFLGIRLDCAQCHDHPFASWKQTDFESFSAFFGPTYVGLVGVNDTGGEYEIEDRLTREKKKVTPQVPYRHAMLPTEGTHRERLAAWVTNPQNPNFARATVNRVWAMLFGRPLLNPVDNLEPNASTDDTRLVLPNRVLTLLADDFVQHGYDLRRLVRLIVFSQPFRLASESAEELSELQQQAWAVFPMVRLRPEQVVGSMLQSASIATIDAESHIIARLMKFGQTNDFLKQYGDTGDDEFDEHGGTIPQRLVLMNGNLIRERIKPNPLNASARISDMASNDFQAIETAYLAALSRRPTSEEAAHFTKFLADSSLSRAQRMEDVFWALLNSTEFSWNH